jgi:beta-lactamase regulating signal transducer with metallopeptidase domain
MIAAWMIYTVAVTLLLFAGARSADYVARSLGAPARFVWAAAMLASLTLSGFALSRSARQRVVYATMPAALSARLPAHVVTGGTGAPVHGVAPEEANRFESLLNSARASVASLRQTARRLDVAKLERWNSRLAILWATTSCAAFGWLLLSLAGLRRIERGLAAEVIDHHRILVSDDVGPALLGILDSRIVVPRWVLSLPLPEQRIIFAHERQHAAALDPVMIYAAAIALALQPWNLALWGMFARLRLALEGDCDRRVLGANGDARLYGRLLVDVYARTVPGLTPRIAFVERPSNLERRIRRMTARPRLISLAGVASVLAALVLSTAAWTATAPVRPPVTRQIAAPVRERERVWQLEPVRTIAVAPSVELPAVATPVATPIATPATPVATPVATAVAPAPTQATTSPCMVGGHLTRPELGPLMQGPLGCTIDGEIVVFALDSARILVAMRDTSDAALQNVDFFVFALERGQQGTLSGSARNTAHAELRGGTFYFALVGAGRPAIAFGLVPAELAQRYPDAARFVVKGIQILRRPQVTWDVLRQLPDSPRCSANYGLDRAGNATAGSATGPLFVVDGVVINAPASDCYVVGGRPVLITLP